MEEKKERPKEEINFLAKLRKNKAAMRQYTKLYNSLCGNCKEIVMKDQDCLRGEGYKKALCHICSRRAEYRMDEVKRLVK